MFVMLSVVVDYSLDLYIIDNNIFLNLSLQFQILIKKINFANEILVFLTYNVLHRLRSNIDRWIDQLEKVLIHVNVGHPSTNR
jgi:hypothetical protein